MFAAYLMCMGVPQAKDAVTRLLWAIDGMGWRVVFNPESDLIELQRAVGE